MLGREGVLLPVNVGDVAAESEEEGEEEGTGGRYSSGASAICDALCAPFKGEILCRVEPSQRAYPHSQSRQVRIVPGITARAGRTI